MEGGIEAAVSGLDVHVALRIDVDPPASLPDAVVAAVGIEVQHRAIGQRVLVIAQDPAVVRQVIAV